MSQKFLIAAFNSGLVKDLKPHMIPEDAFALLQNLYAWRGRIRKRIGTSLLFTTVAQANPQIVSRLRIFLGNTDGAGAFAGNVPGSVYEVGQAFSIGQQIFTVNALGAPAPLLNTTGVGAGTYDTNTGAYTFNGVAPLTAVYFYPATPVMAFAEFETSEINFERYFAFDTQFAYEYLASGWERLNLGGVAAVWTGTDSDFYSTTMYHGATLGTDYLFVVNNTTADGIRYFDGTTWFQLNQSWSSLANTAILGARLIVQFKNRLVLLNTYEEDGTPGSSVHYPNRARFCQIGNPTAVDAWYQPPGAYGKGDFIDAPTQQQIISAQIFKDRLIVYFERSTWELVYTGNQILPFTWQNINIELGVESSFSLVAFDKGIVGIGSTGVHVCNGTNVERIDEKIPNDIYDIHNANAGIDRVYGIRDYIAELAYWAIPSIEVGGANVVYPNRLLVYNYKNGSWAYWNDTVTAFGYIALPVAAAFNQTRVRVVAGGNQEGYTFYMNQDSPTNAGVTQITDITVGLGGTLTITAINHNLVGDEFIYLDYIQGTGTMTTLNQKIYAVQIIIDADTFTITDATIAGTYRGGGTYALVSQIEAQTKQFNFFTGDAYNMSVNQLDFLVTSTIQSEVSINIIPSTGGLATQTLYMETAPYNAVYYPYEQYQDLLWHTVYVQVTGTYVQLSIGWDDDEMLNYNNTRNVSRADFQLHAIVLHVDRTASRLQ